MADNTIVYFTSTISESSTKKSHNLFLYTTYQREERTKHMLLETIFIFCIAKILSSKFSNQLEPRINLELT